MLNSISNDETNRTEHSDIIDFMTPSNPSVAEIPSIISDTFSKLEEYKNKVEISEKKAQKAKVAANDAGKKSAGLGKKKAAIEALQGATVGNAEAIDSFSEAQKTSFEYQTKLGEICKYLFALGVSNIAANRRVVRELELKLQGASKEEIDDLARQEILNVIRQLKAQEDIMKRQEEISSNVKEHNYRIVDLEIKNESNSQKIKERINYDTQQDEHIEKIDELNKIQDDKLGCQELKDIEHDKRLDLIDDINTNQDRKLEDLICKVGKLEKSLEILQGKYEKSENSYKELEEIIKNEFGKTASIVFAGIGTLGLILAIISFFL